MKTEYKNIYFVLLDRTENGKPVYECLNKTGVELAEVSYYPKWKKYVDERQPGIIFDASCNRDIAHFMDQLDQQRKNITPEQFDKLIETIIWLGCAIIIAALIRGCLNQ